VPGPGAGVGQPEVGTEVDDLQVRPEAGGHPGGLPGGQGQERQVAAGTGHGLRVLEPPPGQGRHAGQVGMDLGDRPARVAVRGDRAQLQVGVAGEQPEQLTAGVSAAARHRHPRAHPPTGPVPRPSRAAIAPHADAARRRHRPPAARRIIMQSNE
jgi:hypothetical protein